MTGLHITCLIPAWNEGPRIGGVLSAVIGHPAIARVLVVDDGSTDNTAQIARAMGAEVIVTPTNGGKTRALYHGLCRIDGGHVLMLDADLVGLRPADIDRLIAPVAAGRAAVSLSLRGNAPRTWRAIGLDYITGERLLPHALIAPALDDIPALPRFGFEVFLNALILRAHLPVAVVRLPDLASPSKASKQGVWRGIAADIAMMRDIFRTVSPLVCLRQIAGLWRARVAAGG